MRKAFGVALLAVLSAPAFAQVHVDGYYRQNGTYVQPHMRSSPNNTTLDNYSTRGNVNPYTGQAGTVNPYPAYTPPPAYAPAPVYIPAPVYQAPSPYSNPYGTR